MKFDFIPSPLEDPKAVFIEFPKAVFASLAMHPNSIKVATWVNTLL
jgi:hypothetical protein